jgi:hypothetical protein
MNERAEYNFHDQSIAAFSSDGRSINIVIDCYDDVTKLYRPIFVKFAEVRDITIDDVPSPNIGMVCPTGEIVHFELLNNKALILVEWDDYQGQKHKTMTYGFSYAEVQITDALK